MSLFVDNSIKELNIIRQEISHTTDVSKRVTMKHDPTTLQEINHIA